MLSLPPFHHLKAMDRHRTAGNYQIVLMNLLVIGEALSEASQRLEKTRTLRGGLGQLPRSDTL